MATRHYALTLIPQACRGSTPEAHHVRLQVLRDDEAVQTHLVGLAEWSGALDLPPGTYRLRAVTEDAHNDAIGRPVESAPCVVPEEGATP